MPDREKVIKAYEDYVNSYIPVTTYGDYVFEMHKAVLVLLKEQEETINDLTDTIRQLNQHIKDLSEYMTPYGKVKDVKAYAELLKEQEAEWIEYPECLAYDGAYSDSHIVCSACKHVFSIMDNCTEEFDYCPHCGAKMKQEGR